MQSLTTNIPLEIAVHAKAHNKADLDLSKEYTQNLLLLIESHDVDGHASPSRLERIAEYLSRSRLRMGDNKSLLNLLKDFPSGDTRLEFGSEKQRWSGANSLSSLFDHQIVRMKSYLMLLHKLGFIEFQSGVQQVEQDLPKFTWDSLHVIRTKRGDSFIRDYPPRAGFNSDDLFLTVNVKVKGDRLPKAKSN